MILLLILLFLFGDLIVVVLVDFFYSLLPFTENYFNFNLLTQNWYIGHSFNAHNKIFFVSSAHRSHQRQEGLLVGQLLQVHARVLFVIDEGDGLKLLGGDGARVSVERLQEGVVDVFKVFAGQLLSEVMFVFGRQDLVKAKVGIDHFIDGKLNLK